MSVRFSGQLDPRKIECHSVVAHASYPGCRFFVESVLNGWVVAESCTTPSFRLEDVEDLFTAV